MKKTLNQWLDWIDSLDPALKASPDISSFKQQLIDLKFDESFKGYSGTQMVELPHQLEKYLGKGKAIGY